MKFLITAMLLLCSTIIFAQYEYEPSKEYPYGRANPNAAPQLKDYAALIGICDCKSVTRKQDRSWADTTDMVWVYKYIMNGMAVQDMTLKPDGKHSGSIRQYNVDSTRWYVHYYSSGSPVSTLPAWEGNKNDEGQIILYREQAAPNGMEGYYKITFKDITKSGFNWLGVWVDKAETFEYPTWKIFCKKR